MWIFLSLLVALVGLVMWLGSTTNPKVAEAGKIMFTVGLLAFLISVPQASVAPFGHSLGH